ncbi:RNA polymerase II-associated protein 3 isoform X2 [Bombus pyrosoma]|uniref:RNA polymerase II-associated protein 3 isoform X2 n=1 Tax=Bombus pyrosoma TaxID=396416 RepID=UPI001CB99B25|nr:RNA polymerase II-associated protein 3 isoform X2 [Bombus pyrosoma]
MQARVRQYSILSGIMIETNADVTCNAKSGQKSLLERYDIPVEHLSYEYISECAGAKKLERIVTILRSGEEGHYPDLLKHAEERLSVIKPTSIILRKSEPILKRNMLEPNEYKEIDKDIKNWMSEMQIRERDLEEGKTTILDLLLAPDIRQFKEQSVKKNSVRNSRSAKSRQIASCDYAAWDKYDVDTELNKMDIQDEQQKVEAKRLQQKQNEIIEKNKLKKHSIINKAALTGTELDVMAKQEKEKGNEAFRAGDYEEALEHYNTSIKMNSNIITYNNRAITYIKLQRYEDALNDCNIVLSIEHTNIKALLRRAALADYEAALKLAPNDIMAIIGVKRLRKPCNSKTVRMTITEEQIEDTNKRSHERSNEIEETRNYISQPDSSFNLENHICFCDKAPGPSHCLRPRPHIKAEYCFEDDKGTTTIKTSKKSNSAQKIINLNTVPTKNYVSFPNNFSFNIPKETQEKSNPVFGTKQKSIFSFTRPPARTSSVIIEELPNEPSNNQYANVRIKPNKTVANKNTEVTNKSETNDDKQVEVPNAKNLNKSNEQSGNSNKKCNKISPGKVKVADKYKNKTSKPEKYIPKDFGKIENGYEFMRIWRSLKNDTDLEVYAQLLRSLDVNKLNSILGNEMDGDMFSTILHCLEQHFCTSCDMELLSNFLKSFCQMKRFSIVNMFMSTEDKQVIRNILNFLEEHGASGISSLRQIYCI